MQARLARAWVQYEMGQTYPAGSGRADAGFAGGRQRFDALYDQQPDRLAGFYARLGRGLCWKDIGESEKALAVFKELLNLPDDPADFHTLRGKAAVQALETSLRPEVKKSKEGLDIARQWIGSDHPQSASGEAGAASVEVDLAIRYLGGEAALAYLKTLPDESPEQSELRTGRATGRGSSSNRGRVGGALPGEGQAPSAGCGSRPCRDGRTGHLCRCEQSCQGGLGPFLYGQAEQKEAARSGTGNDPMRSANAGSRWIPLETRP